MPLAWLKAATAQPLRSSGSAARLNSWRHPDQGPAAWERGAAKGGEEQERGTGAEGAAGS
jgi:hypothetical protein